MNKNAVYSITNIKNKKQYVGSSNNYPLRWSRHKCDLQKNCHLNQYLQNAWNKNGASNFIFEILEEIQDENLLLEFEQQWIDKLWPNVYNLNKNAAKPPSRTGIPHTLKTKKKMRFAALGEKNNRYGKPSPMRGKHHTKKAKIKLSKALSGPNHPMYGKHLSLDTKEKMSKSKTGKNNPMFGKSGPKSPSFGLHLSEETKEKIRQSLKLTREKRKEKNK